MVFVAVISGSVLVRLNISEVTNVSLIGMLRSVSLLERIVVRASSHAALSEITILVDVESVHSWAQASEFAIDLTFGVEVGLLEPHDASSCLVWLRV